MPNTYTNADLLTMMIKGLRAIGYQENLLKDEYSFVDVFSDDYTIRSVELAAFAHEPPSYKNACFGIIEVPNNSVEILADYKALGAPQIFTIHSDPQKVCRWKLQVKSQPVLMQSIEPDQIQETIIAHKDEWNPEQVLRAKSIGYVKGAIQLDFSDAGLLPVLESFVYTKLDRLLRDTISSSELAYKEYNNKLPGANTYKALFRLIFRLIAAKLLGDRHHPGNWLSSDVKSVIKEVENFYTIASGDILKDTGVQEVAWRKIRNAFSFQNLSVEALAYVYENTFVSKETRKSYGTHATTHAIAEYVIQHLPIEQLDLEKRYIFEPFAGHAPFLIAALQRLRSLLPLDISVEQRHEYFVQMLGGIEIDAFACEVARYSLILADYPNPNGWFIENDNFFSSLTIVDRLRQAKVILCNPPYEDFTFEDKEKNYATYSSNRAVEVLNRVLSFKPEMIGFVLPRSFVDGRMYAKARKEIAEIYDDISLTVLPDNAFHFSALETVLLIAHGKRTSQPIWSSALIKKADFENFTHTGIPTWFTKAPHRFIEQELQSSHPNFWYDPMQPIWDKLAHLKRFAEIAEIHKGIQHNLPFKENQHSLISDTPKAGFVRGLIRVTSDFEPYTSPKAGYINIEAEKVLRPNTLLLPWEEPKIITNAVRLSRGPWTIAATIDEDKLVCMQNFHGIWSQGIYPLEVIAALLNGPVANAFLSTHNTTKHNKLGTTKEIPVPELNRAQIRLIVSLVQTYISYRKQWHEEPNRSSYFERLCKGVLKQIDGEILAAYGLTPDLEQKLLFYFDGYKKPGPIGLTRVNPSPMKRLYTSLIKVEDIKEDSDFQVVEAIIINWDPHQVVRIPINLMPDNLRMKLVRDMWLLARVNVGAKKAEDLVFQNIELAPEKDIDD